MKAKQLFSLILLLFISVKVWAQDDGPEVIFDCTTPTTISYIDTNDLKTDFFGGTGLFGHEFEAAGLNNDPEISTQMMTGLWMGGFDPGGNLKLAASTYGIFGGNNDYFAGPLLEDGATNFEVCDIFNRFWVVRRAEIEALKQDFEDNGILDNPIPEDIRTWPGAYNEEFLNTFGIPISTFILAPYFDKNGDGIYNVYDGDYPEIKGDIAYWKVANDNGNIHGESGGLPLQMEVQIMAYAFYNQQNDLLNSTIFYDVFLRNKAAETIDSLFIGLWAHHDLDFNCGLKDYVGSIPSRNMTFAYTPVEPENVCDGEGFQNYIVGLKLLKGPLKLNPSTGQVDELDLASAISYNISSTGDPIQETTWPTVDTGFYNLLNGKWKDGSPVTIGGNGYGGTEITKFSYPDSPDDPDGWSICTSGEGFRKKSTLMNVGPLRMGPGAFNSLSYAAILYPIDDVPCPNLSDFINHTDQIDAVFNGGTVGTEPGAQNKLEFSIYPNPASQEIQISLSADAINQLQRISIYDVQGREVIKQVNNNTISISTLKNGFYFVECLFKNGKRGIQKLVVTR